MVLKIASTWCLKLNTELILTYLLFHKCSCQKTRKIISPFMMCGSKRPYYLRKPVGKSSKSTKSEVFLREFFNKNYCPHIILTPPIKVYPPTNLRKNFVPTKLWQISKLWGGGGEKPCELCRAALYNNDMEILIRI